MATPLTDDSVVDYFKTDLLPATTVPADAWKLYLGDPGPEQVYLGTLAQLRAALAPNALFLTQEPTATPANREGQLAFVTVGQLTNLWQFESSAWVERLKGFVLGTAAAPAAPVPVVALGSIAPGRVGVQLTLNATASVSGGAIAKVEFFDGGTKIGEATTTPYATSYVPTSAGTHYFTAKATDTNTRSTVSSVREAVISAAPVAGNQLPSVSLSLTPGGPITVGQEVALSAVASDSDGTIAKVEFFDGSAKVGEATATPYTVAYTPTATGTRLLAAKATDNAGGSATASQSLVVNAAAPVVTVPAAPTAVVATAGNGSASLTWSAPASNGGAAVAGYNVYRAGAGTALGTAPASQTNFTDTTAVNGAPVSYEVAALNSKGEGPRSEVSNSVTPSAPPVTGPPALSTYSKVLSGPSDTEASGVTLTSVDGSQRVGFNVKAVADTTGKRMDIAVAGSLVLALDLPASYLGDAISFESNGVLYGTTFQDTSTSAPIQF